MPRRTLALLLSISAVVAVARAGALAGLDLYADEAYYWLWSTRPAAGYFDHPPMVAWIIWLSSRLAPGELGVRLLFALVGGLTVLFTGLAARAISGRDEAAVPGALLAAGAPMLHLVGALALPDGPAVAAYAASIWLIASARGRRWIWAGAAVGAALLSKYTSALLAPALLLLVAWDRELRAELRSAWPWLGGAVAVLLFLPNLLWNAHHGWVSIGFQLHHGFRGGATLATFLSFLGAQIAEAGPVALPLGLALALRPAGSADRRAAAAVLVPLLVTTLAAAHGDVEVNWPAVTYPGLAALAAVWLVRRSPRAALRWSAAQAALGALVLAFFAREIRSPHLLAGSVTVARFHSGREVGREARALAEASCRARGLPERCAREPFVYPSSYQVAGYLAYYAGWMRQGPAEERVSQLDLWDERPGPGEPFFYVGQDEGPGPRFRSTVRASGEGPTTSYDVTFAGRVIRHGTLTSFDHYEGGDPRR